jgi:hypothetical protein
MQSFTEKKLPQIQELTWYQVKDQVKAVNPTLFDIIEDWQPPAHFKLYKISYRYGDKIIKNGVLHVPGSNGSAVPISSARVHVNVKESLSYSHVPLGLLLNNGQEVFIENEDRVIPVAFFTPGVVLGLWESLEEKSSFAMQKFLDVSAGARSIFLLPKVAEAGSFERLKKFYGVRQPMPRKLSDHAAIFAQISKHKAFQEEWSHDILFFSKEWLVRDAKNVGWLTFHHHLLEQAWALSAYNRNSLAMNWISH